MQRLTERDSNGDVYVKQHDYVTAADKLAHYEDLEEFGLLVKLPCKVGTEKLYMIAEDNEIYYLVADEVTIKRHQNGTVIFEYDSYEFGCEEFGKTVFLTEEEAEAKLKEMEV